MKKDAGFVNMIIAFSILAISFITFAVLLINYEVDKPYLPTPTPIVTPTTTPTNTPMPTPTPGYTKSQWNKLFVLDNPSYTLTETITDNNGKSLTDIYKIADGSVYVFDQTSEKAAKETWSLLMEEQCMTVTGTLALNSDGVFEVNKNGYKATKTDKEKIAAQNNDIIKKPKEMIDRFRDEISYKDYECVEVFKLYKTKEDGIYKVTITIDDNKLKSMEIEYADVTDPDKPKTIRYLIEINNVTGADIIESNPKK